MCLEKSSANRAFQALQNQVIQIQCGHAALKILFSTAPLLHDNALCQQSAGEARCA